MSRQHLISLVPCIAMLLLAACANPMPPSGGARDKTPPEIVATEPPNNTINFHGDEISLEFNKYMDKNKVIECVLLSPNRKLKFKWSGKTLNINIDEPLDSNTTYSLLLGTDYTDFLQNKPTDAYTLTFSTGAALDSGRIIGRLDDINPSGVYIYAYLTSGMDPDTLNINKVRPHYLTQVGTSGNFELKSLKSGNYRIVAIRDLQKNMIYNEGPDAFGAAAADVEVRNALAPFVALRIGPPVDNAGPMLYSAEATSSRLVTANFSENIDTFSVGKNSFAITDSSGRDTIPVSFAFIGNDPKYVEIVSGASLVKSRKYKLIAMPGAQAARDSTGNAVRDTASSCYFYSNGQPDTTILRLTQIPFRDSTQNIDPFTSFDFLFNSAIKDNAFEGRIALKNLLTSKPAPIVLDQRLDNKIVARPSQKLESACWYELTIKLDSLRSYTGRITPDSTLRLRFKTADIRNYTEASGSIRNWDSCRAGATVLTLVAADRKRRIVATITDSMNWSATNIPPGKYSFEIYCDVNGNGKYDYGYPFPFRHAEPFAVDTREVTMPPRMKVENIIVDAKK